MIKKQLFLYLFSFVFIAPVMGMDNNKSIQNIRFTSNFKENYPYLVNNAYKNKDLNNYAMEQFVLNQKTSIQEMNAATQRGAKVYLTVGAHSENKMDTYQSTTIKRDPTIHGKVTIGLDESPSKKKPTKGILLFGSANTTNQTWQHKTGKPGVQFNFEAGIEIKDDMDIIPQAYKMIKSQSPMKPTQEKITIDESPKKICIYSSKDTNLNASLALRLDNAAKRNDKVSVRSMTFSNQEVTNALCALGSNAELIVDSTALTSKGIPLLQQMHDAKTLIHVFYPPKGSRTKQHAKDVIIESENKNSYISSTANITAEGDKQRNYQLYIPNNQQVIADAKEDFAKVKKESITFPEALKRKMEDTAKKSATKKQKVEK